MLEFLKTYNISSLFYMQRKFTESLPFFLLVSIKKYKSQKIHQLKDHEKQTQNSIIISHNSKSLIAQENSNDIDA